MVQLLQSDDGQENAVWSPDGKWIVYTQDAGGNEINDVYAIPSGGGAAVNLTHSPDTSEDNPLFSPDGQRLVIAVKAKTASDAEVAILDWKTRAKRILTHEQSADHLWQPFAWSKDGRHIYANRVKESYTDSDVYEINAETGQTRDLTPHTGDVQYMGTSVSSDGRVLLNSTAKGGYQNVAILDAATRRLEWMTDTQWEASAADFAPDGSRFAYVLNQDGRSTLYVRDTGTRASRKLAFPDGITRAAGLPSAFSPDGTHLLVYHEDARRPSDLWTYDLRTNAPKQLSHSALASLNPGGLPSTQLVHYKSFDGTLISAYVWMPFNLQRDASYPALVLPHGGPTSQTIDDFNTVAVALASRGYICISPNVRGSTGYGLAFQKANYKDLGGGDLQDEIFATRFLVETGDADPKRCSGSSIGSTST